MYFEHNFSIKIVQHSFTKYHTLDIFEGHFYLILPGGVGIPLGTLDASFIVYGIWDIIGRMWL